MQLTTFVKMSNSIPDEYKCPITLDVMTDPVIGPDGHTYERSAIEGWIASGRNTSPVTRGYMSSSSLTPNIALRNAIERWRAAPAAPSVAGSAGAPSPLSFKRIPMTLHSTVDRTKNLLHMKVTPPFTGERQPIVLTLAIDNSGSMGDPAAQDLTSEAGRTGFTRLDLVLHVVRMIISMMRDTDTIAITSFSTSATIVLAPTNMTAAGKARALDSLKRIRPDSQTNIWDGIKTAQGLVNTPEFAGRHIVGLLLTDGLPNVSPPDPAGGNQSAGIMYALNKSLQKNIKNPLTFHTFGFGYNLDSELLASISAWGTGLFGFIPDHTMAATVLVNFLSWVLSTASPNTMLTYSIDGGAPIAIQTGPVMFGQARDFVVPIPPTAASITVSLDDGAPQAPTAGPVDIFADVRAEYMNCIQTAIMRLKAGHHSGDALSILGAFEDKYSTSTHATVRELLMDIRKPTGGDGEIRLALADFARWGEHYLRSYLNAQQCQEALNFKDPGLKIYAEAPLFKELQEQANTVFLDIPPPTPSLALRYGAAPTAPISSQEWTQAFYNVSGGCFHPNTNIRMADGSNKRIHLLRANENVWTPTGQATIRAVVVCGSYSQAQHLSKIGNLHITPYHPILIAGKWQFPQDIVGSTEYQVSTVYNLLLDSGHIVAADDGLAVTLAHGFKDDIVSHPFFGTDAVVENLKQQTGWEQGRPTYTNQVAIRDATTGMVCGWKDEV